MYNSSDSAMIAKKPIPGWSWASW